MNTILHRLNEWANVSPFDPAQRYKDPSKVWKTITAQDYLNRVYWLAVFLESRGINGDSIGAILSYNCPEWVHADLALPLLGGKSVGIYPSSTQKDIHYILNHTEAKVLSVQNKEYYQKITGEQGQPPLPDSIELIIVFDNDESISRKAVAYSRALEEGRALSQKPGAKSIHDFLSKVKSEHAAFLIYTSGTTGTPKGAILSHDNLTYTSDLIKSAWVLPMGKFKLFSFLPLCHVAETLQNIGMGISLRYSVSFCTKFENISKDLPEVEPHLLLCVPRLWEKMMEGVMAKIKINRGFKKEMALWALGVGSRISDAKFGGPAVGMIDMLQYPLAEKLVLSKIRKALGLGQAVTLASGAAVLPAQVTKWFRSIGLEILEDYGQTESTGVICVTSPGEDCAGTVGRGIPGSEFKIAEDGEILSKGRHIFMGYFRDESATKATIEDGWLKTGDLAVINERGLVQIKGRKKEIMKTSGGKMIAPLPIEEKLKVSDAISQVCLVGDGNKYLSALVTLSEELMGQIKKRTDNDLVVADPEIIARVREAFDGVNATLAGFEQIKKFTVLAREFSIADGEMTPTLKMKRNIIENNFKSLIQKMYE